MVFQWGKALKDNDGVILMLQQGGGATVYMGDFKMEEQNIKVKAEN